MDKLTWLTYGMAAIWAGIGLYLFFLSRRQKALEQRLLQLELTREDA